MDWAAIWYADHPLGTLLAPLGLVLRSVVALRRAAYEVGVLRVHEAPVPVIVVGNIAVGGTGKTPLVIWLSRQLARRGHVPGVVSRGHGGEARADRERVSMVTAQSDPAVVGDEPVLIATRAQCPVAVCPRRHAAAIHLVENAGCDVIVSDDGLQHLALARDAEIAVVDGARGHGNRRCLPAGPLREPVSRLDGVDLVVTNGAPAAGELDNGDRATGDWANGDWANGALANGKSAIGDLVMTLEPGPVTSLVDPREQQPLASYAGRSVHAACGIGNPDRFFRMLSAAGVMVVPHPFPDHHRFAPGELDFGDDRPVLMTEKDAVKYRRHADPRHRYVPVEAVPGPALERRLEEVLGLALARASRRASRRGGRR